MVKWFYSQEEEEEEQERGEPSLTDSHSDFHGSYTLRRGG